MDQFKKYLEERINSMEERYQETKALEKSSEHREMSLAYNSYAASLTTVKYELLLALEQYGKLTQHKR